LRLAKRNNKRRGRERVENKTEMDEFKKRLSEKK
jgi:hypothetical protein